MLNLNKVLFLDFNNVNDININIFVPFEVSKIKIKGISCISTADVSCVLMSSLVNNNVIGYVHQSGVAVNTDIESTTPEIEYIYKAPKNINGYFNFSLLDFSGLSTSLDMGLVVIIEFIK